MNVAKLRGKRAEKGLNRVTVARALYISEPTFRKYENSAVCQFTIEQIKAMIKLYNLTLDEVNCIFFENSLPFGNTNATYQ